MILLFPVTVKARFSNATLCSNCLENVKKFQVSDLFRGLSHRKSEQSPRRCVSKKKKGGGGLKHLALDVHLLLFQCLDRGAGKITGRKGDFFWFQMPDWPPYSQDRSNDY